MPVTSTRCIHSRILSRWILRPMPCSFPAMDFSPVLLCNVHILLTRSSSTSSDMVLKWWDDSSYSRMRLWIVRLWHPNIWEIWVTVNEWFNKKHSWASGISREGLPRTRVLLTASSKLCTIPSTVSAMGVTTSPCPLATRYGSTIVANCSTFSTRARSSYCRSASASSNSSETCSITDMKTSNAQSHTSSMASSRVPSRFYHLWPRRLRMRSTLYAGPRPHDLHTLHVSTMKERVWKGYNTLSM